MVLVSDLVEVNTYGWCEVRVLLHSFAYGYPVVLAPSAEESNFPH